MDAVRRPTAYGCRIAVSGVWGDFCRRIVTSFWQRHSGAGASIWQRELGRAQFVVAAHPAPALHAGVGSWTGPEAIQFASEAVKAGQRNRI